ncbi:MAG: TolC family protein, partial [Verrucomicrobiales bacterium]|nr:TolC family protein [Verrucomicrobiales bacterium]
MKKRADREVFGILKRKSSKVPNSGQDLLDITPKPPPNLESLERNMTEEDFLGERGKVEMGAKKISLSDALSYAVHHNRSYQGQKELVYLGALDLTLARFQFTPIFSAGGTSTLSSKKVEAGLNDFINDSTLTSTGSTGFSVLSRAGTRIATDLTTDFVKFITGDLKSLSDSSIAVTLTQPLLRGAGYRATSEALTQAERDVLYSVRDFTQYRKTFTVDITSQYFRTLQNRESVRNSYLAYKAFNDTVEREKLLAETGQRPTKSFLYQVQQAQLSYDRRWRTAIRTYEQALDDLKIQLGIPVTETVMLDRDDFTKLEVIDPPGTLDDALATALTTRLDLWNQRDQVEDAARKVKVALQNTLPTLNAVGTYDVKGDPGRSNINVDGHRRTLTGRLDLDLNLNQKPVRNDVRSAQIAEQRSRRELELAEEQVRNSIRTD